MYEQQIKKTVSIFDKYTCLVDKHLEEALKDGISDGGEMNIIGDGIRILGHVTATLERLNRLSWGNSADGQCSEND